MGSFGALFKFSDIKIVKRLPQFSFNFKKNMRNMLAMREYRLFLSLVICQKLKLCSTLKFLLTQDHMVLKITKRYAYSFHLMSPKLYKDIPKIP